MSDDLDNRKQRMWNMEEVRGGDTDIDDSDTQDTADTTDAVDMPDTAGTQDTEDPTGTSDTSVAPGTEVTEDTSDATDTKDTADSPGTAGTTDTPADVPSDASIRELFLAAQEQGLTVDFFQHSRLNHPLMSV